MNKFVTRFYNSDIIYYIITEEDQYEENYIVITCHVSAVCYSL